ncbi:MAG: DUF4363 family protein [Ruminococcaceae bacterium]|nr:DUF4363 family protein [Oscillospiraceae bacterium]
MRAVRFAVICLFTVFVSIIGNSIYISKTTEKFADAIKEIDTNNLEMTSNKLKEIYASFKKAERFISITVSHDDLTNIDESFSDIIGAAEAGMKTSVITIKSRLEDALRHLGRLSGINLESII